MTPQETIMYIKKHNEVYSKTAIDIAKTLEKYPPHRLCDEWQSCADDCDIQARDMHCEDCDMYWGLVELAEKGDIDLRDIEKEEAEWKRICEICC